jgi:Xaa-Pro aminopeptidase
MRRARLGALLVTNRADQYYLTGFDGEDGAALITPRDVHIMTDARFDETLQRQAPWARKHDRKNGLPEIVARCCRSARVCKVAVQGEHIAVNTLAAFRRSAGSIRFVLGPPIVAGLRLVKDRTELRHIRQAVAIAEAAFKALRRNIRVGMTEIEVAARLEFEMKNRGSQNPSFRTIVAEGPNAALPHAEPGSRRIKAGSAILVDWGATSHYYCSDLTRMIFVGTIPPRLKCVYQIVLEAQERAIAAIRPGVKARDIDHIARDHITGQGYGKQFGHGLGHGIGLDIHEAPRVRRSVDDVLEPGMVVTVEPGIYLPRVGGIRIEDDVLITARGHEVLTSLNKSIRSAIL